MTLPGSILLVARDPGAALPVEAMLRDRAHAGLRRVQTVEAALRILDADPAPAAVLLDLSAGDAQSSEALTALAAHPAAVPVLALLQEDNPELGLAAVLAGAQDYLVATGQDAGVMERALHYAAQRRRVESALVERALYDTLTGLPRRRLLLDRLEVAMKRCARDGSSGTLLFIDLDQFKQTNETHGRAVGDAVLRAVGQRISAMVRDSDTVARFGSDEFVVLLPNESRVLEALAVGEKLVEALGRVIGVAGQEVQISASIGVARFRDATEVPELVVQRAEQAVGVARRESKEGKPRVRLV